MSSSISVVLHFGTSRSCKIFTGPSHSALCHFSFRFIGYIPPTDSFLIPEVPSAQCLTNLTFHSPERSWLHYTEAASIYPLRIIHSVNRRQRVNQMRYYTYFLNPTLVKPPTRAHNWCTHAHPAAWASNRPHFYTQLRSALNSAWQPTLPVTQMDA
jgi:hypothetical protein